jgi:small subunit ribosomal protein S1
MDKDPMDWFKDNGKKEGSIITTRVAEVLKTGVKVSVDPDKHIIVMIKKNQLAKEAADARPEIFVPGNALDAMITELDLEKRKVSLSVKEAQIYEEKNLLQKFGAQSAKAGATLADIFGKALGKKTKKKEEDKEEE